MDRQTSSTLGAALKFELHRRFGYADIKRMENNEDVDGLIEALKSPRLQSSGNLRAAVVTALRRIGATQAVSLVSNVLVSDSAEKVRGAAANALGEFQDPEALPALQAAMDDDSKTVRLWAMRGIGRLRDRESVDRLVGLLESPDWRFRSYAAGALGDIGDQRATDPLLSHLDDRNGTVRLAVYAALRRLGDSRSVPAIREARKSMSWWRRRRLDSVLRDLESQFGG